MTASEEDFRKKEWKGEGWSLGNRKEFQETRENGGSAAVPSPTGAEDTGRRTEVK